MNVRLSLGLLTMAAGGLTLSQDAHTAQGGASYTMYCRGGNVQKLYVNATRKTIDGKPRLMVFSQYWLTKSKQRYSPQTLKKGECAWASRPINRSEPTVLKSKLSWAVPLAEMQIGFGPHGNGNFHLTSGKTSQMGSPTWRYFQALNDDSKIIEVAARTHGKELEVTQVRAIHSAPGNHVKRRGSK